MKRVLSIVLATIGATLMALSLAAYAITLQMSGSIGLYHNLSGISLRRGEMVIQWGSALSGSLAMPLWSPVLLLGVPTAYFIWLARRPSPDAGRCAQCGYDLRGISSATCPECGTAR